MDKVIHCTCGNEGWILGKYGARCSHCHMWLHGDLVGLWYDVERAQAWIDKQEKVGG